MEQLTTLSSGLTIRNHSGDRPQKLRSPFSKALGWREIYAYRKLFVNPRNVGYTPLIHLANFEMGRSGVGKPEGRSLCIKGDRNWGEERGDRGCIFEEKSDRQEKGAIAIGGKRGAIALRTREAESLNATIRLDFSVEVLISE